jgi:vacuolar iron transporter family protein
MAESEHEEIDRLRELHTSEAIAARLGTVRRGYLRDFIFGAVDGVVTTFAVVAGAAGAGLEARIVIILGTANLLADGFSMSVGNFLSSRAEIQQRDRARGDELRQIRLLPEGEREEIRQIFAAKGLEGEVLETVVETITGDPELWVDTMVTEELGYGSVIGSPVRAAAMMFAAFVALGSLPLAVFALDLFSGIDFTDPFAWSAALTGLAFFVVGALKSRFVDQTWWRAGLETLTLGGAAAVLAYLVGVALQNI